MLQGSDAGTSSTNGSCRAVPRTVGWDCAHNRCATANLSHTVATPSLLIFFHIAKTGGTSLMFVLDRLVRPPHRLTASFRYGRASCLLGLFPQRFRGARWRPRCGSPTPPDWRHAALAVEYHDWSSSLFTRKLRPQLGWLRAQYAAVGGRLVVATLLRDPAAHLLSWYRMAPPIATAATSARATGGGGEPPGVLPVVAVLGGATRLQQRVLDGRRATAGAGWRARVERPCDVDLRRSRALLRDFDVVGLFDRTDARLGRLFFEQLLLGLDVALYAGVARGAAAAADGDSDDGDDAAEFHDYYLRNPHRPGGGGARYRQAKALSLAASRNASVMAAVRAATACDRVLYDEARRAAEAQLARHGQGLVAAGHGARLCAASGARGERLHAFFTRSLTKMSGYQRAQRLTAELIELERDSSSK